MSAHPNLQKQAVVKATLPRDKMNRLERKYADRLALLKASGDLLAFDYEPETFRLADRTGYTPDFRVILKDLTVEFHEVKGFWEDDARVKFKTTSAMHPFYRFVAVTYKKGWAFEAWQNGEKLDKRDRT